jgi:hypothetical protein
MYTTVVLFDSKYQRSVKKLSGKFTEDKSIGIIVAWRTIIAAMSRTISLKEFNLSVRLIDESDKSYIINISSLPTFENIVELHNVDMNNVYKYYVPNNYNAIWILDNEGYSLYKFKGTDFLKGFVKGFEVFNRDFRDYSIGKPFVSKHEDLRVRNIPYNIKGYDIPPIVHERRLPVPIGAFYTNTYETYDITNDVDVPITDEADSIYPQDFE